MAYYVGKLLSNVKGFYNEINSATLTGAIDVVIVKQEDNSYLSSPFHVRFGKMGVIRAREKVVDIEINGKPVDLHMKLGEAGEAFFVQEAEEAVPVPAHLATSPIPESLNLMEEGLENLKRQVAGHAEIGPTCQLTIETQFDGILSDESTSTQGYQRRQSANISTQTDMTAAQVEHKSRSRSKSRTPSGDTSLKPAAIAPLDNKTETPSAETDSTPKPETSQNGLVLPHTKTSTDRNLTSKTRKKRRRKLELKREGKKLENSVIVKSEASHPSVKSTDSVSSTELLEEAMFEMDLTDGEMGDEDIPMLSMGRTVSMPVIEERQAMTEEWASSQYKSHFHPFSDGDITPILSPVGTRPPSPKSDTEYETQKYDATSQTQLTGDDMQLIDDVRWEWGELPQSSQSQLHKSIISDTHEEERSSGGLFQFMKKTKKIRHQPQQEGIYLDDLNLDDMDPEVAALYLYPKGTSQNHMKAIGDEDNESGRGASLPQSPVTIQECHNDVRPLPHKTFPQLADITMSLCGGLKECEAEVPHEKFLQHLVTYDDFCQNPNLLMDTNMVVRMGEKYYNWQVAGPIIMSALAFHRPLPDDTMQDLMKRHMPKKERRRWMWWGRGTDNSQDNQTGNKKDAQTSTLSSPPSSAPNSPLKKKEKKRVMKDGYSTDEESDETGDTPMQALTIETNQETTCREKYKKSLKLTSEQIAQLNLKEGMNEISFSVTTQYQGTTKCYSYVFLWKWDDRLIVSDIDGTITKSDVLGQVLPMIGKDWSQAGIANLYSMISRNGYKFLFLSARAIGQSKSTRDMLRGIRQGDLTLPTGPLLLSPSSLISAFHKEVIERKPEEFKIGCLRDIVALFPSIRNPFYAGFGNKINDVWAYRAVGIPISKIFTVNHRGELTLELTHAFKSSYSKMSDIVDHLFPPLMNIKCDEGSMQDGNFYAPDQYSSFTYWQPAMLSIEEEIEEFVKKEKEKDKK